MSRNRTRGNGNRVFRFIQNQTATSAANRLKFNASLVDLRSVLESIAGQGEEFRISKATLLVTTVPYAGDFVVTLAAMAADQSIGGVDPGENTQYGFMDDDFDVMTTGDYELTVVAKLQSNKYADATHAYVAWSGDVTTICQKASAYLARAAMLSSNPYMNFVASGIASVSQPLIVFNSKLILEGKLGQKALRLMA